MKLYLNKSKYWKLIFILSMLLIALPFVCSTFFSFNDKNSKIVICIVLITSAIQVMYALIKLFQLLMLKKESPLIFIENDCLYDLSSTFFKIKGLHISSIVSISEGQTNKNATTYKLKLDENSLNRNQLERLINKKPKISDTLVDSGKLDYFIKQIREDISKSNVQLL